MKYKEKLIKLILILSLIIIFSIIFLNTNFSKVHKNDDFLFLKLFFKGEDISTQVNSSKQINQEKYIFKVNYKNMNFKSINLLDTYDKKTSINEKIAPGTKGSFYIQLNSNQNLKYQIKFQSINEKPKNLKFKALQGEKLLAESNTLEGLSEKLYGYIRKNEEININVCWYWYYEEKIDTDINDFQDTIDSQNIRKYQFNVFVLGEEEW